LIEPSASTVGVIVNTTGASVGVLVGVISGVAADAVVVGVGALAACVVWQAASNKPAMISRNLVDVCRNTIALPGFSCI
jgi:hypothetical protein